MLKSNIFDKHFKIAYALYFIMTCLCTNAYEN